MANVIRDNDSYFPKNAWQEIDQLQRDWSSYFWRIQEVAKTIGKIDDQNFRRMELRRCICMSLASAFLNGVFDERGKPICPVACVETERQTKTVQRTRRVNRPPPETRDPVGGIE